MVAYWFALQLQKFRVPASFDAYIEGFHEFLLISIVVLIFIDSLQVSIAIAKKSGAPQASMHVLKINDFVLIPNDFVLLIIDLLLVCTVIPKKFKVPASFGAYIENH